MCGIVGAVAERDVRDVVPILLEGLKHLEYRGYDSAGVAVINVENSLNRVRMPGKVQRPGRGAQYRPPAWWNGHRPYTLGDSWCTQ